MSTPKPDPAVADPLGFVRQGAVDAQDGRPHVRPMEPPTATSGGLAARTKLVIAYDREDDGRWIAEVPAIPGALVYGDTQDDARRRVLALALRALANLVEHDEPGAELAAALFDAT